MAGSSSSRAMTEAETAMPVSKLKALDVAAMS